MIKERIIKVLENKGIPKEEFYQKIGMTSASFRGNAKQTPLNSNAIENILSELPDLSPLWLLTGQGQMFDVQQTSAQALNIEDKLLNIIKEKDEKIISLIEEIGYLKGRVKELEEAKEKPLRDAGGVADAAVG